MNLFYDEGHGKVHFNNTPGKTQWVNRETDVNARIQAYLRKNQSELDCLYQIYGNGGQTSFYIVDLMSNLPIDGERYDTFVIQGGYERKFDGVNVNYHMYPTREDVLHFGIGTTNNSAMADGNKRQ